MASSTETSKLVLLDSDAKIRRLARFVGQKVSLRTIWQSDFEGIFVGFDDHMNVMLKKAKEFRRRYNIREENPLPQTGAV
jgi:small nuclear ribonucleoprotein (snRNP)-like protein